MVFECAKFVDQGYITFSRRLLQRFVPSPCQFLNVVRKFVGSRFDQRTGASTCYHGNKAIDSEQRGGVHGNVNPYVLAW